MLRLCSKLIEKQSSIRPNFRYLCSSSASSQDNHIDLAERIKQLQPSEKWLKTLNPKQKSSFNHIQKELEVFVYMGTFIPFSFTDKDWTRTLESHDVKQRLMFWEYLGLKHIRQEKDSERKAKRESEYTAMWQIEAAKFEKGEMGYGHNLHQLIINPLRNRKKVNHIRGARIERSIRIGVPEIALDLQNIEKEDFRNQQVLGHHVQYLLSENFDSNVPFPIRFFNFKENAFFHNFMKKSVGFYSSEYTDQTILPDITTMNLKQAYGRKKEIIYISRHAREVLDGPLSHDVYVVPLTMDTNREALGNGRRAEVRTMRLPIQRYVKWQSGPMVLPANNIAKILRDVYRSGGDWKQAFLDNISKRHFLSVEERENSMWKPSKRKDRKREFGELLQAVKDATGQK